MNYSHGQTGTKIYFTYRNILNRCYRKSDKRYECYGGRGISVCEQWKNDFNSFYDWAIANGYKEGLSIDRIDVNGDYKPSNCRWVTMKQQQNNRRNNHILTLKGISKTISEWSEVTGIKRSTIERRINKYGWNIEKALNNFNLEG